MLPIGPCAVLSKNDYLESLDVNFFSVVEINRQFMPLLLKSNGRIVNMSSMVGKIAAVFAPYAVSKCAVESYSDCLRRELYHQGVTVHVIEPGGFATNLTKSTTKAYVQQEYNRIMNNLPENTRDYYGTEYSEKVGGKLERYKYSKDLYKVVDAYVHALTAKYPKIRYMVGTDANTIFRFLYMCPDWISDYIIAKKGVESIRPRGLQK
ncbi:hypothetical protein KUTeg_001358 [Tegillarca granosa]|uniref:Uncharacterized protein n=1 Tax=Tegillarca granosa TaxID=220873 RepID=A0ABQ9FSQ2_TEGGR|nr:hypothetical protein KUTeg_001358 [Tegillarca granosa]